MKINKKKKRIDIFEKQNGVYFNECNRNFHIKHALLSI